MKKESYREILADIIDGIRFNYTPGPDGIENTGYYFPEITKNPSKYILSTDFKKAFQHLKSRGISLFIATNSGVEYADMIMKNSLGEVNYEFITN